jgi:putative heme-binding domain-containing protein
MHTTVPSHTLVRAVWHRKIKQCLALFPLPALLALLAPVCESPLLAQQRVPWTTSHIHGTPEPPPPYVLERLYPKLAFNRPLDITPLPGTNRLVVLEESGRMFSFIPGADAEKADPFGNLSEFDREATRSYALTFHPRFKENRFVFTWLVRDLKGADFLEEGTRIVRFRVTESSPPQLDLSTAQTIITWRAGGHNGGNLRFGPDGMLYISTGDGTRPDPPDAEATGQDISDLLSSVLRIDVDHPDKDRFYSIPGDNPFLDIPKARGEVWAYGLRNPWRMSFDPKTGELFVGDVGWELWEAVYRVRRGGNYGWSITEASRQDVRPDRPRGRSPVLAPLVAHPHGEAASITGGEFYHGKKLPDLQGAYLYGDWQMGTFWLLRNDGDKVREHRELARSSLMPVGFGIDHEGELLIVDYSAGGLWQLTKRAQTADAAPFPRKLSETGLFTDTPAQTPAPGVTGFKINAPRWADHATAQRWVAFPDKSGVTVASASKGVVLRGRWEFPAGAVLAKTYSLDMERGNPATRRRVETQVLHYDGALWGAYSYRWNAEQTDAELVPREGAETTFTVQDAAAPGGAMQQRWRFYSRSECARCHTLMNTFAQGFSALQLDRTTPQEPGRQLDALIRLGIAPAEPRLTDPHGTTGGAEVKARSYLHANCGVCHQFNCGGGVPSYMNIEVALKDASLIDARPVQGGLDLPDARVIASGDPSRSVLLYRMATAGRGHMPYLGSHLVDDRGILLVRDWIAGMRANPRDVSAATLAQRKLEEQALAALTTGDASQINTLLASNSGALSLLLAILDHKLPAGIRSKAVAMGGASPEPLRRDLFERFLPASERRKVLGPGIQTASLLTLKGDAPRGRALFGGVCASCHRVGGGGIDFGPDLTHIATKWSRAAMLEQILAPSKIVEPQWQLTTLETRGGGSKAGFVTARTAAALTLRMAGGRDEQVALSDVVKTTTTPGSVMPEGLLQSLTAQEAADLLEYLATLK